MQVSRLIPEAQGTKCNEEMEPILNTMYSHILRVPFHTSKGILPQWVSRFDIYPYLERFAQASLILCLTCIEMEVRLMLTRQNKMQF